LLPQQWIFSHLEVTEGAVDERPRPTPMFLPLELIAKAAKER
jgi:hypothetical protein